jgi:hypothetical protein
VSVMIGVDPHKGSHTAVTIDGGETDLSQVMLAGYHWRQSRRLGARCRPLPPGRSSGAATCGIVSTQSTDPPMSGPRTR